MRLLAEVIVIAALIYLGWEKPFRDWTPWTQPPRAHRTRSTSTQPGAWMWDKDRKTPLDRPAYNQSREFSGHITYVDEKGHQYWLDAQGNRHYEQ